MIFQVVCSSHCLFTFAKSPLCYGTLLRLLLVSAWKAWLQFPGDLDAYASKGFTGWELGDRGKWVEFRVGVTYSMTPALPSFHYSYTQDMEVEGETFVVTSNKDVEIEIFVLLYCSNIFHQNASKCYVANIYFYKRIL